jgi:hypothetical protein
MNGKTGRLFTFIRVSGRTAETVWSQSDVNITKIFTDG